MSVLLKLIIWRSPKLNGKLNNSKHLLTLLRRQPPILVVVKYYCIPNQFRALAHWVNFGGTPAVSRARSPLTHLFWPGTLAFFQSDWLFPISFFFFFFTIITLGPANSFIDQLNASKTYSIQKMLHRCFMLIKIGSHFFLHSFLCSWIFLLYIFIFFSA